MPVEKAFFTVATDLDAALIDGMSAAVTGGLAWAAPQLGVGLSLYVIGHAMMMMYGRLDGAVFMTAIVRAMAVVGILQAASYDYYVRKLFFVDLPNAIAAAINGPRVTVNSAQQFDVMWSAVLHFTAFILGQATGVSNTINRGIVWVLAYADLGALWVIFGIWYISRGLMAIVICLGPFLIILYLFQGTREYVNQWVGKLVGLTVLQLGTSILLRILQVILSKQLRLMDQNPGKSVDDMISNAAGITGIFWFAALFMFVLPGALAIGSGVGASVAVAAGMFTSVGSAIGGGAAAGARMTVRGAADAGKRLGQYTGSRGRGTA